MKTSRNKLSGCIATFTLLVILFSCEDDLSSIPILKCSFENDMLGGVPDKALPGAPSGDYLVYGGETDMDIVPTSYAPYKSLLLPPGESIQFVSKHTNLEAGIISFRWSGKMLDHSSNTVLHGRKEFIIHDGMGHILVKIVIQGTIVTIRSADQDGNNGIVLGGQFAWDESYNGANQQHTFFVEIRYTTNAISRCSIGFIGPEVNNPETKINLPLYGDPQVSASARPTLTIINAEGGEGYVIDDVFASYRGR